MTKKALAASVSHTAETIKELRVGITLVTIRPKAHNYVLHLVECYFPGDQYGRNR